MSLGTKASGERSGTMPRYFLHLHDDVHSVDEEGVELANLAAARLVALHNARFSAGQALKETGRVVLDHRIDIEDSDGKVLDTVSFRDAVTVEDRL